MLKHLLSNDQFRREFRTPEALAAQAGPETIASYLNKVDPISWTGLVQN